MSAGWVNLRKDKDVRALEKHYRETGYSDGYAFRDARSDNAYYRAGYLRGREARVKFDREGAA